MPTTALPTGASASTSLMGAPRAQFMSARFDGKGMSKDDSPPRPGPASGLMSGPGVAAPSLGPSSAYGSQAAPLSSGRVGSVLAAGATAVASAAAAAVGSELVGQVVDGIRKTVSAFRDRGESGSTETEIVAFGSIVVDPEEQVQLPTSFPCPCVAYSTRPHPSTCLLWPTCGLVSVACVVSRLQARSIAVVTAVSACLSQLAVGNRAACASIVENNGLDLIVALLRTSAPGVAQQVCDRRAEPVCVCLSVFHKSCLCVWPFLPRRRPFGWRFTSPRCLRTRISSRNATASPRSFPC